MYDALVKAESGNDELREHRRSGQLSWLFDDLDKELFNSLNSRIESFTELSTKFSEPYQIVNYGLGGHYVPHLDPFSRLHVKNVTYLIINTKNCLNVIYKLCFTEIFSSFHKFI